MIVPKSDEGKWIGEANAVGLFVNTIKDIAGKPNKIANRVVLSFSKNKVNTIEQSFLTIRNHNGSYSEEYIELTKDFHWTNLS